MIMFENIKIPDKITDIYIDVGLSYNAPHTVEWLSSNPIWQPMNSKVKYFDYNYNVIGD
tara:strand:- start:2528 stop:2704 length:177 start_codon:yes stop_codon:yes gene_type:complete